MGVHIILGLSMGSSMVGMNLARSKHRHLWRIALESQVEYLNTTCTYWLAVKEVELSYHNGYIYVVNNRISPIQSFELSSLKAAQSSTISSYTNITEKWSHYPSYRFDRTTVYSLHPNQADFLTICQMKRILGPPKVCTI